jgi:hypothetical protein
LVIVLLVPLAIGAVMCTVEAVVVITLELVAVNVDGGSKEIAEM